MNKYEIVKFEQGDLALDVNVSPAEETVWLSLNEICLLFGRDKKIVPTVEFYPPKGLTPAEVGLVIDGTADKKDLISMIIYYAGHDEGEEHI